MDIVLFLWFARLAVGGLISDGGYLGWWGDRNGSG